MPKSTKQSPKKDYPWKEYRDRHRKKRDDANLCIMCGKEPQKPTSKLGMHCHIRMIEQRKLLAKKRIPEGKCTQCLTANAASGRKLCQVCRDRKKATRGYRASIQYDITEMEFNSLLQSANGLCMICKRKDKLNLDHCHSSGVVRGFLCGSCNNGLGRFRDNIQILKDAISYLENNYSHKPK